jgi:hypothetical protein
MKKRANKLKLGFAALHKLSSLHPIHLFLFFLRYFNILLLYLSLNRLESGHTKTHLKFEVKNFIVLVSIPPRLPHTYPSPKRGHNINSTWGKSLLNFLSGISLTTF